MKKLKFERKSKHTKKRNEKNGRKNINIRKQTIKRKRR